MRPNSTHVLLAAAVMVIAVVGYYAFSRAHLRVQYAALIERIEPKELVEVDEAKFQEWMRLLESDDWEVLRTGAGGYQPVLRHMADEYGVEPTINGFLRMQTMTFPPVDEVEVDQLDALVKLASVRAAYDSLSFLDQKSIYVYREDGVVRGFYEPARENGSGQFSILENGVYAVYIADRK